MTIDLPTVSQAAMQLPIGERLLLAQQLWDSIHDPADHESAEDSIAVARRRARELEENPDMAVPHDVVMKSVREALR